MTKNSSLSNEPKEANEDLFEILKLLSLEDLFQIRKLVLNMMREHSAYQDQQQELDDRYQELLEDEKKFLPR